MKSEKLVLLWAAVCLVAGCAKRQPVRRVDYVPAAPTKAASTTADSTQPVVIEEPPPPEPPPSEVTPQEPLPAVAPATPPARSRPRKSTTTTATQESSSEPVESEELQVPELGRGETSASQFEDLRRQIDAVQSRISALDRSRLSGVSRKDLEEATNFVVQSKQALAAGDWPRSTTLIHKALLLVEAGEKQR